MPVSSFVSIILGGIYLLRNLLLPSLKIKGLPAAKAILSVFPLDSFIESPIQRMEIDGQPDELNEVHKEMIETTAEVAGDHWKISSIERFKFYEEAKKAFAIITTNETRPFGCFIFTKGVVKPDGSVWLLDQ